MPYPQRLLNEGEEVALDLKPHWWFFSKQVFSALPLFLVFLLLLRIPDSQDTLRGILLWVWGIGAIVWAGWLGIKYLDWTFTYFVVTGDRVVYRTGVLAKKGVEIPLERINNINFAQTIWERMIGAGDLSIESAGRDGQSVFNDVRHPDGVQQEIYRQMESYARKRASWSAPPAAPVASATAPAPAAPAREPAPAAAPAPVPVPVQLEQLAELRDKGVISHAEFEAKKAELLDRM